MGLFQKYRMASHYEGLLKDFGINPNQIPSKINANICSYATQQEERLAAIYPDHGSETTMIASMRNAARMTALCLPGPKKYDAITGDYADAGRTIESNARDWNEFGYDIKQ